MHYVQAEAVDEDDNSFVESGQKWQKPGSDEIKVDKLSSSGNFIHLPHDHSNDIHSSSRSSPPQARVELCLCYNRSLLIQQAFFLSLLVIPRLRPI